MINVIVSLVILAIISLSVSKIVREKRKGVKCVGCPLSATDKNSKGCGCH